MKIWGCKLKFIIKYTSKKCIHILGAFFALLGILLTVAECVHWMFGSNIIYEVMREHAEVMLFICIIVAIVRYKAPLNYEYFLKGSDIKVNMQVKDVLSSKEAIIIPTNTTFDTKMEGEFISVKSVQGQFQRKYFNNNLSTLDSLLENGLEGYSYNLLNRDKSKNKRYPIGTVSKITYNDQHYYFVAIADVNEYGKTVNTSFENIQLALEGIWHQIGSIGHIENLAIPLIGTGRAGIKDASRERVIKEIIFSFVASAKERKITEKLQICIHPSDLDSKELDLEKLNEYLKYMCEYRYTDVDNQIEGNVIEF